jgi:plastocyanin
MRKRLILILTILILAVGITVAAWLSFKHEPARQTTSKAALPAKKISTPTSEKPHQTFGKNIVLINQSIFGPQSLTSTVGATVEWTNMETTTHQIVTDDKTTIVTTSSPVLERGQSYSFVFSKAGTYKYHDNLHPKMQGTVTVK